MRTIIVDDEQESHNVLKNLIASRHPEVEIVASAYSVQEGLEAIRRHQPDLLFLDIYLPDGLGFDLIDQLGAIDFQVIFFTTSNDHTYRAIKFGALDYLMKPVATDELATSIQKAKVRKEERLSQQQLQILREALSYMPQNKLPSMIGISTADGVFCKKMEDIIWLEGEGAYTRFHFNHDQKPILASSGLKGYEKQFDPYPEFARAHKSHIVNLTYVDRLVKSDGGYLVLKNGHKLDVSPGYRETVLRKLNDLLL